MTGGGPKADLTGLILGGGLLAAARLEHAAARGRDRRRAFLNGLVSEALDTAELETLTVRLYERAPGRYGSQLLTDWESAMFAGALPSPPARILVTAAGSGREVRALVERDYEVDALEPVPVMAATCAAIPGVGAVWTATHDDLIDAVERRSGPVAELADQRFDAVIVGWGSFTHVLSREGQRRLLAVCDRLAPRGPILLSFFAQGEGLSRRVRAFEAGARLGRRLAARRGSAPKELQIGFVWHLGFTHAFTPDEIEALAVAVRRTAEVTMTPYGHAVLRPETTG
jgi:hypothetical protein